jgi:hypothetical protein
VEIPIAHRPTAAAAGELDFVRTCLSRISLSVTPDVRTIALGPTPNFNTGNIYRALHSSGCVVPGQDINWGCFAPLKVRVFFWILRLQKTRTCLLLHRHGCVPSPDCPFCHGSEENMSHLFVPTPAYDLCGASSLPWDVCTTLPTRQLSWMASPRICPGCT